jgi:hypothetical protein
MYSFNQNGQRSVVIVGMNVGVMVKYYIGKTVIRQEFLPYVSADLTTSMKLFLEGVKT